MRTFKIISLQTILVVFLCALGLQMVNSQEMEPRAYSNSPTGLNFLIMGYGYYDGALVFDPSLPVEDAKAKVNIGLLAFAHSFAISGKSARFAMVLPYAGLNANGYLAGVYHERVVSGFADPSFALSINFSGAPALSLEEFRNYQQDTIVGASLKVTAPWGQYESDRLINIGTNKWSIKPELGISQALGNWILEGSAAVTFFTDNSEFYNGQNLEQEPIYSVQGHTVYNIRPGAWIAVDATYFTGGESTVDGVAKDNKLDNWRFGLTLTMPINKYNSVKLAGSTGVSTRTGSDFDAYLLAWQYRWGGGL